MEEQLPVANVIWIELLVFAVSFKLVNLKDFKIVAIVAVFDVLGKQLIFLRLLLKCFDLTVEVRICSIIWISFQLNVGWFFFFVLGC